MTGAAIRRTDGPGSADQGSRRPEQERYAEKAGVSTPGLIGEGARRTHNKSPRGVLQALVLSLAPRRIRREG